MHADQPNQLEADIDWGDIIFAFCLYPIDQECLDVGKEGKTVATFPWVTDFANSIASPAVEGDSVLLAAGYNHNAMCKVTVTLEGAKEVWRKKFPSKVCTPVILQSKT